MRKGGEVFEKQVEQSRYCKDHCHAQVDEIVNLVEQGECDLEPKSADALSLEFVLAHVQVVRVDPQHQPLLDALAHLSAFVSFVALIKASRLSVDRRKVGINKRLDLVAQRTPVLQLGVEGHLHESLTGSVVVVMALMDADLKPNWLVVEILNVGRDVLKVQSWRRLVS